MLITSQFSHFDSLSISERGLLIPLRKSTFILASVMWCESRCESILLFWSKVRPWQVKGSISGILWRLINSHKSDRNAKYGRVVLLKTSAIDTQSVQSWKCFFFWQHCIMRLDLRGEQLAHLKVLQLTFLATFLKSFRRAI